MALFSTPFQVFNFEKTVKFISTLGFEIATINLVTYKENPSSRTVIFIKTDGRINQYHIICREQLKGVLEFLKLYVTTVSPKTDKYSGFREYILWMAISFVRSFVSTFRLEIQGIIELEDSEFNQFGSMIVGSDYGSSNVDFYIKYTSDEMTSLDKIYREDLAKSLSGIEEIVLRQDY
jgi:hypothetical protein